MPVLRPFPLPLAPLLALPVLRLLRQLGRPDCLPHLSHTSKKRREMSNQTSLLSRNICFAVVSARIAASGHWCNPLIPRPCPGVYQLWSFLAYKKTSPQWLLSSVPDPRFPSFLTVRSLLLLLVRLGGGAAAAAMAAMLLLAACVAAVLSCIAALDLSPSYGRLTVSNAGGQVLVWEGYPESAGFNLAAFELTLNENSILFPGHYDTDTVAYVVEGSAKFGLVFATGKRFETKTVKAGDVILFPREANYWFYNDGKGPFKIWGGGDASNSLQKGRVLRVDHVGASSVLHGFTPDVLAAGFNVEPSLISKVINAQNRVTLAKLDGPLDLTDFPEIANGDHVETYSGQLVFPLVTDAPHFSIAGGGALYNLVSSYGEYDILKERSISVELGVQEAGSVLGPIWGPTNHMLYYFIKGSARYQIVSPITNKLEADVDVFPGQVVAIPASYGFVIIAGAEGVEYFTFADISNPTGGSLYASFLDYPKGLVAAAFDIPVQDVDTFVGKRDHNIILPAYKRIITSALEM